MRSSRCLPHSRQVGSPFFDFLCTIFLCYSSLRLSSSPCVLLLLSYVNTIISSDEKLKNMNVTLTIRRKHTTQAVRGAHSKPKEKLVWKCAKGAIKVNEKSKCKKGWDFHELCVVSWLGAMGVSGIDSVQLTFFVKSPTNIHPKCQESVKRVCWLLAVGSVCSPSWTNLIMFWVLVSV